MMCSTRLICRFPARDSRWRTWSPEEASIGAVPFQDAKWALVREPGDVTDLDEQPGSTGGADPVQAASGWCRWPSSSALSSLFAAFLRW